MEKEFVFGILRFLIKDKEIFLVKGGGNGIDENKYSVGRA